MSKIKLEATLEGYNYYSQRLLSIDTKPVYTSFLYFQSLDFQYFIQEFICLKGNATTAIKILFLFARSNTAFQNPVSLLKSEVFSLFTHANDEKSKQIIKHVKLKSAMTNLPKRYFVMTTWEPYRFFKKSVVF